ncbi:MAG: glutamate 5-kinase [Candidatus Omnitrophica bacterium]|nr:glutamate 5-kinase [Candidatus Omnitrophota bacterium]
MREKLFSELRTVVVKVGTSVLADESGSVSRTRIGHVVNEVAHLLESDINVILVSSGAIANGMQVLQITTRPKQLAQLQACAAIGQGKLMRIYEELFSKKGRHTGQLLLTRDGLKDRTRYINIRNTLDQLLSLGVVPIINENDTVSTEEIRFGDNDILAAQVATLIKADCLILLSDIDGLYCNVAGQRKVLDSVTFIDDEVRKHIFKKKTETTLGGMESKLKAADVVMKAGISMLILNGHKKGVIKDILNGRTAGTLFFSGEGKKKSFKNWLAFSADVNGMIVVDDGAKRVLVTQGRSLLPVGVIGCKGWFSKGDIVSIVTKDDVEFARGITKYSSAELASACGKSGLGEVVHRDNLVITAK